MLCAIVILLVVEVSTLDASVHQKACEDAGITFQDDADPENGTIEVEEGGLALIPCRFSYHGRENVRKPFPFWQLDYSYPERTVFLYQGAFPVDFSYNESAGGLFISNVDATLNGTRVACAFDFFYATDICQSNHTVIIVNEQSTMVLKNFNSTSVDTLNFIPMATSTSESIDLENLIFLSSLALSPQATSFGMILLIGVIFFMLSSSM